MPRRFLPLLAALLVSCGGGGGGSGGGPGGGDPFGLAQRVPVTGLTFPSSDPQPGLFREVDAFPSLSFNNPLFLTHAPGDRDRLFVAEQRGTIQVFANDAAATTKKTFLDIQGRVDAGGEKGLLGLAFDPAYATSGFFYVYYSADTTTPGMDHKSVVARYSVTADPDVADPASETILLQFDQPYGNHNGGCLGFGPDGHLYVASGDGGGGGDLPSLRGAYPSPAPPPVSPREGARGGRRSVG